MTNLKPVTSVAPLELTHGCVVYHIRSFIRPLVSVNPIPTCCDRGSCLSCATSCDVLYAYLNTQAIETDSSGPNAHVYYANRAAARQHLGDFAGAAEDSRNSIRANPKYVKSYTRLAQACMSLKQWSDAIDACEKALEIDETNATASAFLAKAQRMQAAAPAEGQSPSASTPAPAAAAGGMPDLSGLLGAMGGGGGGGGGGMPDLGAMMNNPMMQNMMQNMMSNPEMMQNMMSSVGKMMGGAGGAGGAGGMPDLSAMMNDPNIRQMAEQVRGSMGATPNAGAAGASDDVEIENADEADEAEEVN